MDASNSRLSFAVLILSLVLLVGGGLVFAASSPGERAARRTYRPPTGVDDEGFLFTRALDCGFDVGVERVQGALAAEGFSVLSETDFAAVLGPQGNGAPAPYLILVAYDPALARGAHESEHWIGVVMPCTVVVRERADGTVVVGARNPALPSATTGNGELRRVNSELTNKLLRLLAAL
jgi:uncharacterized protein (DUF302 family)